MSTVRMGKLLQAEAPSSMTVQTRCVSVLSTIGVSAAKRGCSEIGVTCDAAAATGAVAAVGGSAKSTGGSSGGITAAADSGTS